MLKPGALTFAAGVALCAAASAAPPSRILPHARYVAMGSSFAAGPGIPSPADAPQTRCARSTSNYAHQLAAALALDLVDVSCSGATTANILGRWNELAPQIDAVMPETALVTVTIGGNDVGYIGTLGAKSCLRAGLSPDAPIKSCPPPPVVDEQAWRAAEVGLRRIAREVRARAPKARLVFVDYLSVLPARGRCTGTPLSEAEADSSRATARRLASLTARVAAEEKAGLVAASALSRGHDACSSAPWINGFPRAGGPQFVPYHPNAAGMTAIASELRRQVSR